MKYIKDKKIMGIAAILIILFVISLITYGNSKKKVFKEEYMNDIFTYEDDEELENDSKYEENNLFVFEANGEEIYETESSKSKIVVEIKGEVVKPDVYSLDEGSIIKDLIDMAGGLTDEANISNINRAKELNNHELIIIYNVNDEVDERSFENIVSDTSNNDLTNNIININTADESQLRSIPGVGEVKANAIISYREKNGGFKNIDEIKNVDGIGEKTFEKIKELIKL